MYKKEMLMHLTCVNKSYIFQSEKTPHCLKKCHPAYPGEDSPFSFFCSCCGAAKVLEISLAIDPSPATIFSWKKPSGLGGNRHEETPAFTRRGCGGLARRF
jgi:hypothetical protein